MKEISKNKKIIKSKKDLKDKLIQIFTTLYDFHSTLGSRGNLATKYRVSSYAKIISILNRIETPIYSSEDLKDIEFIGKSTLEKIDIIVKTGTHPLYEEVLKNKEFKILLELQKVRGIGPQKAYILYKDGYTTPEKLRKDVLSGKYNVDENLKYSLMYYKDLNKKIKRGDITQFTNYLKESLKLNIMNSGSYRMGKAYSGDIDLLCVVKNSTEIKNIIKELKEHGLFKHIYNESMKKINGIIENPLTHKVHQMDMLFVRKKEVPWMLLYFGSGKEFSKRIRLHALQKGYKLNESGLYDIKTGLRLGFHPKDEREIFVYLDFPYVIPEKR
jgi:DNA polymerase/3'-5' exonuclease PolX